jgi:SAM-dependent methyltransferase
MSAATLAPPGVFFGPFLKLREQWPDIEVRSYFTGICYEFERDHSWDQDWDLPAYRHFAAVLGADAILDVGCGAGRIVADLTRAGLGARLVGVDDSAEAGEEFRTRLAFAPHAEFVHLDVLGPHVAEGAFDLAILGSVTINDFATEAEAVEVLRYMRGALRPGGHALLGAFQPQVLDDFAALGRAIEALPFTDGAGVTRLLWRGVDYDPRTRRLRHNHFVEGRDGDRIGRPGVLGFVDERVWTTTDVARLAGTAGLTVRDRQTVHVSTGGAEGWPCDVMLLAPEAASEA